MQIWWNMIFQLIFQLLFFERHYLRYPFLQINNILTTCQ